MSLWGSRWNLSKDKWRSLHKDGGSGYNQCTDWDTQHTVPPEAPHTHPEGHVTRARARRGLVCVT